MPRLQSRVYLAGLFTSSLGSMTYAAVLPALLYSAGISPVYIGCLIGSMRLTSFAVNMFFGHWGDIVSPKKIIILSEVGAAIGSLFIFLAIFLHPEKWLFYFFIANHFRMVFVALQIGSVQKFGKVFDNALDLKGRFSVYMNGATNGSLMFGALAALLLFHRLTIPMVVAFDAVTFLLNGLLVWVFQSASEVQGYSGKKIQINIKTYLKAAPRLAGLDFILSLSIFGANVLNLRLLPSHADWVPLMPAVFGATSLLVSFGLDKKFNSSSPTVWFIFALSLVGQGVFSDNVATVLVFAFFRNLAYWVISMSIGRELMQSSDIKNYGSIGSGRSALTVATLASGEFWVGLTRNVPVWVEMSWRGALATAPAFASIKKGENPCSKL